jgi:hypothetical protein
VAVAVAVEAGAASGRSGTPWKSPEVVARLTTPAVR